jgi:hypothetical protein
MKFGSGFLGFGVFVGEGLVGVLNFWDGDCGIGEFWGNLV